MEEGKGRLTAAESDDDDDECTPPTPAQPLLDVLNANEHWTVSVVVMMSNDGMVMEGDYGQHEQQSKHL